jgi:hypothetical protein
MAPDSHNGIERHFVFVVAIEKLEVMGAANPLGAA